MKKVVMILGPTGVGKTQISIGLAKALNGEIISLDAFQVYKGFDIGTAKVTADEMQGVPHHLIDILNPTDEYSAGEHARLTKLKIEEILKRGKLPILVGGTGLYAKSLMLGYNFGGSKSEKGIRNELNKVLESGGLAALCEILKNQNTEMYEKTDLKNPRRVIRAIEISKQGIGKREGTPEFDYQAFVLNIDRKLLHERINSRVDRMLKDGLYEEVSALQKKYNLNQNSQAFLAIGYKEFLPCINKTDSFENCVLAVKAHSRQYAKRQLTFFRGMENLMWVDATDRVAALETMINAVKNDRPFKG